MLKGIEILDQIEVNINYEPVWWLACAIGMVILLAAIAIGVINCVNHQGTFGEFVVITTLGVMTGFALFAFTASISRIFNPTDIQTQYKVTISDEVNLNEFNERYEIIDQEGKIYTIAEKE